jgi:hypothetical protein
MSQNPTSPFQKHAEWYLALAFEAQGKKAAAAQLFQKIAANTDHPFYTKAQEVLKQ